MHWRRKGTLIVDNPLRFAVMRSAEFISMNNDVRYVLARDDIRSAYYGDEYRPLLVPPDMPEIYRNIMMIVDLSVVGDAALMELKAVTVKARAPLNDDSRRLRRIGDDDLRGMRPIEREALSELNAGLRLLKAEFKQRRLGARWLAGRALQMRCTEDAIPCNLGQAGAAQSVENQQ
jgi:hypothetical protein